MGARKLRGSYGAEFQMSIFYKHTAPMGQKPLVTACACVQPVRLYKPGIQDSDVGGVIRDE